MKYVVEYKNTHNELCATRVYRGIKLARNTAMQRKIKYGSPVHLLGFDGQGHRVMKETI